MLSRPERRFDGYLLVIVIFAVASIVAVTKLGRKQVSLYDYGKWTCAGFGFWIFFRFVIVGEGRVQGVISAAGVVLIIEAVVRRKVAIEKSGFHVDSYGGPDGGIVVYREEDKSLNLLYSRETDTVYIPTDSKWKQIMPKWSHERKDEIVAKVKLRHGNRLIGKAISYEETELDDRMAAQASLENSQNSR